MELCSWCDEAPSKTFGMSWSDSGLIIHLTNALVTECNQILTAMSTKQCEIFPEELLLLLQQKGGKTLLIPLISDEKLDSPLPTKL